MYALCRFDNWLSDGLGYKSVKQEQKVLKAEGPAGGRGLFLKEE